MSPEVKRALKAKSKEDYPLEGFDFDALHNRIMAAVEKTEIAPVSIFDKPKNLIKTQWKSWLVTGSSLMMIFLALLQAPSFLHQSLDQSHTVQVVKNEDDFSAESLKSPEDFSHTLISYQSESDFFVDVAERTFHDLSKEQMREIMGEAGP